MTRSTHTYVTVEVTRNTYEEVFHLLTAAGYDHAIDVNNGAIDMHGLALVKAETKHSDDVMTQCTVNIWGWSHLFVCRYRVFSTPGGKDYKTFFHLFVWKFSVGFSLPAIVINKVSPWER